MRATDFAWRIADIDARIAEIELRIVQQQKRVENLLAKGADVSELRKTIAMLTETSIFLEACKADLEHRRQGLPET